MINEDKKPKNEHPGRYNKPTVNEISVLILNNKAEYRDIIVPLKNNSLMKINEFNPAYDCLQYPILFPYGTSGYHCFLFYNSNKDK